MATDPTTAGAPTAGDLVAALLDELPGDFPDHQPGTRPLHSVGVGAIGWFRGTAAASRYSKAGHFTHEWTPVRVRFSNGNGQADPDGRLQVRGMAIRFYIGGTIVEDETGREHAADGDAVVGRPRTGDWPIVPRDGAEIVTTDLICMSVPMFMADSAEAAWEFEKAYKPQPVRRPSLRARLKSLATMCPIPPQEYGVTSSGALGALAYANSYPPSQGFVVESSMLRLPASYARTLYHAVHAFQLEDGDGCKRMVRFFVSPAAGVRAEGPPEPLLSPTAAALLQPPVNAHGASLHDRYLTEELGRRLASGAARFNVRIQIADPWDDTRDPTKLWEMNRTRAMMGTITLNRLVADQDSECEDLSFNPGRLVAGIAPSDDPVLATRIAVYEESYRRRMMARGREVSPAECPVMHH